MAYLRVVVPRGVAELHGRHENIGLHPADVQLAIGQYSVVAVAAYHVRQDVDVALEAELEQRRDHGGQPVGLAPESVLVQHPAENWHVLSGPAGAHFRHAAKLFQGFDVSRREAVGRRVDGQAAGEVKVGRQPVGLSGVELESVESVVVLDAQNSLRPIVNGLRSRVVKISGTISLPPTGQRRLSSGISDDVLTGNVVRRAFRVDERMNPQCHPESLEFNAIFEKIWLFKWSCWYYQLKRNLSCPIVP